MSLSKVVLIYFAKIVSMRNKDNTTIFVDIYTKIYIDNFI